MLPLKLRALSDESDESDSDTETPRITKELLEEKALKEYREALTLKQQKHFRDAETLLLNLVNSSLLSDEEGQVGFIGGRIQPSLLHLKYGCFINLGSINAEANKLEEALEYYVKAIELDSTDINIWYKIGKIALDVHNLDLAVQAFNHGFECNESHWPTLDSLITALFSIGDYLSCLYMIWRAFELDADYVKGHVFKQYISLNHACFIETFKCVHADCTFGPDQPIPSEYEHLILDEAFALRTKAGAEDQFLNRPWEKTTDKTRRVAVRFCTLAENTWEELGERMMELYEQIDREEIQATYYTPVLLISDPSQDNADIVNMKCAAKVAKVSEPCEPQDPNIGNKPNPSKKRNAPSSIDQSHLCDKRRSSRQRGLNKKEDPSLCVALRSVIPGDLLPPREIDIFKDSPDPLRWTEDTLDLFAMFDELEDTALDSTGELSALFVQTMSEGGRNSSMTGYFGSTDREHADVSTFLSLYSEHNILNLFLLYLRNLCLKWNTRWPSGLKTLYCRIFNTVSAHFSAGVFKLTVDRIEDEHSDASQEDEELVRTNTMLVVLVGELTLNACIEWGDFRSGGEEKFPSILFQDLYEAECRLSLASDPERDLYLRLKHFTCLWPLYTSSIDLTCHIEHLDSLVAALEEINYNERLVLVNSRYYHVISKDVYGQLRSVLEMTRDLRDVVAIYTSHLHCDDACNHSLFTQLVSHLEHSISHEDTLALVKLLKLNLLRPVTSTSHTSTADEGEEAPVEENEKEENIYDVITQYDYLLKLCHELKHNERCFKYSACYLNKLISRFKKLNMSVNNAPAPGPITDLCIRRRATCVNRISDIISRLLYCIDKAGYELFSVLPRDQYKQLILNLCQLICFQIEFMQESANLATPELTSVPFDTIQHWLVLYYIVKYEEAKPAHSASPDLITTESSPDKSQEELYFRNSPYSTRLLFIAHEYLGKRGWCCHENGLLLFKIIDVVTEDYVKYNTHCNLENASFIEFLQHIDQVFYCLYGHPASKQCVRNYIKQKYYLQSHNALGVAFTYERAKQIYFFYKIKKVAEFDTLSKNFSISFDVETLFEKIIREIPESEKPDKYIDLVRNGIKNSSSFSQIFSRVDRHLCQELRDIYYLLGDYHFKNKVFAKAIPYYLMDICANHSRVDAWAAMTLSQQNLIDLCLNSGDTISNADEVTDTCLWTCNSFKIATSLNSTLLPLYIEYGTFAYTISAFCSRRIKCESVVGAMSLDQFTALEKLKTDLLNTCKENFERATEVLTRHYKYSKIENDDKWIHLYMLGKYYEKTEPGDPKSYLNYYFLSLETLRTQNGAVYSAKVNYSEPQTGAVESLEIFYRIHATILKFIDRSGDQVLDRELADYYLGMLRNLSVSRFAFTDNDPVEVSCGNVTIVEEENEQDVEIICTVQEVMSKILKLTQMAGEQEDLEEDSSSESDGSSSENTESESESSETESESSDDTSSSEGESDTDRKKGSGKKRKQIESGEDKKDQEIRVEEEGEQESRKRKGTVEELANESDTKRVKTETDPNKEDIVEGKTEAEENMDVDKQAKENAERNARDGLAEVQGTVEKVKNETTEEQVGDGAITERMEVQHEIDVVKCESVKTETADPETKESKTTENCKTESVENVTIGEQQTSQNEDVENKGKSSDEVINLDGNDSPTQAPKASDPLMDTKENDTIKDEAEVNSSYNTFPLPSKKMKVMDSINLLDSINSSCDNIFENLNKIAFTCDIVEEKMSEIPYKVESQASEPTSTSEENLSETADALNSTTPHIDKEQSIEDPNVKQTLNEKLIETKEVRRKSNDSEIEIIEETRGSDKDIEILDDELMDVGAVEEDSESYDEEEVLDPESGMFITVKQKKIKEDNKDGTDNGTSGEQSLCETGNSLVESQINEESDIVKKCENKSLETKEEPKPANPKSKTEKQSKDKGKTSEDEEEEESSEEEESESSESESSSSSEEKVPISKTKKPLKRKLPPKKVTKRVKKRVPRNDQKKQEMRKWKKDKQEITDYCISALEECHRRFPEHFKSLYRIAHHYCHSTSTRDLDKARAVLLGDNGLFRARNKKDFFKGLWRTPITDLDRPGSFAYHMARSIHLVIDLLTETKDAKTLMDIAVALKDEPEAEKKYLRDNEREQFCQDALTMCEKIVKDNLEEVRRNAIHMKSDMKIKIFSDTNDIQKTYNKTWSSKDSVYSKMFYEMTKIFQKNKAGASESGVMNTQPRKSKSMGEREGEASARKDTSLPYVTQGQGTPLPRVLPPSVSSAEMFFGSHFLASSPQPRVLPSPQPQPIKTMTSPQPRPIVRATPSPQPRPLASPQPIRSTPTPPGEMSLQQKLAAKQNPTGNTKVHKITPQPMPLVNRPNLTVSSASNPVPSSGGSKPSKLQEPGKIMNPKPNPLTAPKTVTINPTKYLNKTKQRLKQVGLQSDGKGKVPPPATLLNIKTMQRPTHLPEPGKIIKATDPTGFKLPKSVSLTKVQNNPTRPESPKPKPAHIPKMNIEPTRSESPKSKASPIPKVNLEPTRSESPKPKTSLTKVTSEPKSTSSPKLIDLTTPLPKALSITKVNIEEAKAPEARKQQSMSGKVKKLNRIKASSIPGKSSGSNPGLSMKTKKLLGPKSKTKEISSSGTSTLKNFRKPKDGKDKDEIIMIELD